jgi:hypothetical protein
MSSLIQVDRKEWEDFLEKLSELERKYQLVLNELDTANSKLQAIDASEKHYEENTTPAAPALEKRPPEPRTTTPEKRGFLTKLKAELLSIRISPTVPARRILNPNTPPNYASCSRCGRKIMHATRFCDLCGADFGKWVCSCGRELPESASFCDHCGRRVEDRP